MTRELMSVTKRKSKKAKSGYVWQVQVSYVENNSYKRYTKSGFSTKKEALQHEHDVKQQIENKGTIKKDTNKTLDTVYREFLDIGVNEYQPSTIYSTTKYYQYFKDELGSLKIKNIDYKTLQNYFNSRSDQGIESNKQVKKALSRILRFAIKCEYIETNPLLYVTVSGKEKHLDHEEVLSLENFYTIIAELDKHDDFRISAYCIAIKISYYTGLRISEVLALEKRDFDFDNCLINIQRKLVIRDKKSLRTKDYYTIDKMKSKYSKSSVPIADVLTTDLIAWFNRNPYERVCCNEDGYYLNPNSLSSYIKNIAKKKGFHFHFHQLRHSYCTALVIAGVDVKVAQELMRHANVNTTLSVYTHVNQQKKVDVVNNVFKPVCNNFATNLQSDNKTLN